MVNLQRIASTGWGFSERGRIGDWELRAAGGFTSRANCAWPIGDPGKPLAEALDHVADWYTTRGLPPRIQTLDGSDLDREIAELGFATTDSPALRQTADLAEALALLTATADPDRRAEISAELPEDFFTVYHRGQDEPHAATVLTSGGAELRFAVVRDADGAPLAVGRLATDRNTQWSGLSAIHTTARARRQGLARVIMRDLLAATADADAGQAYLEVEADNNPARTFYESLGFATAHPYYCRVLK
jgi:ribosomal protein S18 acetylase RimI-like enzyme